MLCLYSKLPRANNTLRLQSSVRTEEVVSLQSSQSLLWLLKFVLLLLQQSIITMHHFCVFITCYVALFMCCIMINNLTIEINLLFKLLLGQKLNNWKAVLRSAQIHQGHLNNQYLIRKVTTHIPMRNWCIIHFLKCILLNCKYLTIFFFTPCAEVAGLTKIAVRNWLMNEWTEAGYPLIRGVASPWTLVWLKWGLMLIILYTAKI